MFGWLARWRQRRKEQKKDRVDSTLLEQISYTVKEFHSEILAGYRQQNFFSDPDRELEMAKRSRGQRIIRLMEEVRIFRGKVPELKLTDLPEIFREYSSYGNHRFFDQENLQAFKAWTTDNRQWLTKLEMDLIFKASFLLWLDTFEGQGWLAMMSYQVFDGPLGEALDSLEARIRTECRSSSSFYLNPSSWPSGGGGGRESTSKGSIGHDRLNVKTLSPSEWRARLVVVLGIERLAA